MIRHHRLRVELTLLGPVLTRGGEPPAPGIDAPVARGADGRAILPFSLVKGKVLDAALDLWPDEFAFDGRLDRWVPRPGSRWADWLGRNPGDGSWEPERGRLRFGDLTDTKPTPNPGGVIQRVRIDAATGSATERMLAVLEAPYGYGQEVTFAGFVDFLADDATAAEVADRVTTALRWVPAYGSLRTVGFGRTARVATELQPAVATNTGDPAAGTALPLQLTPDRPLCLVGKKHSRNHFDSLDAISGAVLKGAVARLLAELNGRPTPVIAGDGAGTTHPTLWRNFEHVRFAEARPLPAGAGERPVVPPLSVVAVRHTEGGREQVDWRDAALCDWQEAGRPPPLLRDKAPAFDIDWKRPEQQAVAAAFGVCPPPRERRVRTAIDPQTGRAAENQLFSYGLVRPGGFGWETEIGLEKVPTHDRAAVRRELVTLLGHGLPFLGKTRATAEVRWLDAHTRPVDVGRRLPPAGGLHAVTLQTDCLMTDPELLKPDDPDSLRDAYAAFWREASGGDFELVRFFARQSLHGGYVARRHGRPDRYEPFLLTDRGSTFVLRPAAAGGADAALERWAAEGLPVPKWVEARYGQPGKPLWQCCPFLPHVGFGEVAVDLACHTEHPLPRG